MRFVYIAFILVDEHGGWKKSSQTDRDERRSSDHSIEGVYNLCDYDDMTFTINDYVFDFSILVVAL